MKRGNLETAGGKDVSGNLEEIYKDTNCKVRIGERISEEFYTKKEDRQGCPLNSTVFNVAFGDSEEEIAKVQGGLTFGRRKAWTTTYADDVILIARDEEALKKLLRNIERFREKKGLELNTGKTKIMVCRNGRGRRTNVTFK